MRPWRCSCPGWRPWHRARTQGIEGQTRTAAWEPEKSYWFRDSYGQSGLSCGFLVNSAYAGNVQHGMQQNVAARFQVAGLRILQLIVAYAVLARHKDHGGGRDARQIHGVVARPADDRHDTVGQAFRELIDQPDKFGIELPRREVHDGLNGHPRATLALELAAGLSQGLVHGVQNPVVGGAQIDGQTYAPGNDVARIGEAIDPAKRDRKSVEESKNVAVRVEIVVGGIRK